MGHIKKLSGITTYQIPYIRTILNALGETSKNANSVWDYIINEQNTFNIKESTKEGKIRINVESGFRNRNIPKFRRDY